MLRCVILLLLFVPSFISATEEVDWTKIWPTEQLKGTEKIASIEPEQMTDCSVWVTYALDCGRFGDQLTNYIQALWVSWNYNCPFLYRPFDYSDQMMLSFLHPPLNEKILQKFSKKMEFIHGEEKTHRVFNRLEQLKNNNNHCNPPLLCIISFFTPMLEVYLDENWDDDGFRSLLQTTIAPIKPLPYIDLPKDRITVAMHVRSGAGYDLQMNIDNMPTKFPPDTFYLNGLKSIADHFYGQPLYVYIFTDDPEPRRIRDRLFKELKAWEINNEIVMDCRRSGNKHDQNVLEDFFSMMKFDCLIRPDSNFTRCVSAVAGPLMEAKPSNWDEYRRDANGTPIKDKNGNLIVDSQIIFRDKKGGNILLRRFVEIEPHFL